MSSDYDEDDFSQESFSDDSQHSNMTIDVSDEDDDDYDPDDFDEPMDDRELDANNDADAFSDSDDSTQDAETNEQVQPPAGNAPSTLGSAPGTYSTLTAPSNETRRSNEDESVHDGRGEVSLLSASQIDAENCCIICTETWTNSESHHVVSLKCGHLFGKSCIENWLSPSRKNDRCPQCNKPAKKRDIHKIYARCLKPLDTLDRDNALAKVKELEEKTKSLTEELENSKIKYKLLVKEMDELRYQVISNKTSNKQSSSIESSIKAHSSARDGSFAINFLRDLNVREGSCRLHCYSKIIEALAISVPNSNQHQALIPKFGFKKQPLGNDKPDYIYIHQKPIKDMAINQYDGTITTVSVDKTMKITSLIAKNVIHSVNLTAVPWSVHLSASQSNLVYAGLCNGHIMLYDKRMLNKALLDLSSSAQSPVVSLCSIEYERNHEKCTALMAVQLDTCSVYSFANLHNPSQSNYQVFKLPFEGKFTSSHFDSKSGHSLLSCRPSQKHQKVTHYVFDLHWDEERSVLSPNVLNILEGGLEQVHLSRSKVFTKPTDDDCVLVCAGDEGTNGANFWDCSTLQLKKVVTRQPVLDIELIDNTHYGGSALLSCLSENIVKLYKVC